MLALCGRPKHSLRTLIIAITYTSRPYSKNYDTSDDEKNIKKQIKQKPANANDTSNEESATVRLNRLLASMKTDEPLSISGLARPGEAHKQRKTAAKKAAEANDVKTAAKNVADILGTDDEGKKKTESELLAKLLVQNYGDVTDTKSPLISEPKPYKQDLSLSELIVGMKIDRRQQPQEEKRSDYVRRTLSARSKIQPSDQQQQRGSIKFTKREPVSYSGSVNLFGGKPLGIFREPESLLESPDILKTWSELHKRELELQVQHPPRNYFEKMARWTSQGKVWRFPIDNEQDMDDEKNVDFSEHIFLEQHLEPWCPNKGPIRHFMELVCVGLSKNPYITAQDKKDHIFWYRDYFEAKRDILKDLMSKEKMDKATKRLIDKVQ